MLYFSDKNKPHAYYFYKDLLLLQNCFKVVMKPFKDLCINKSTIPWKGRLNFKKFIPSKRHRFRIKLFVLCDIETGVIFDFVIYTGSSTEINNVAEV